MAPGERLPVGLGLARRVELEPRDAELEPVEQRLDREHLSHRVEERRPVPLVELAPALRAVADHLVAVGDDEVEEADEALLLRLLHHLTVDDFGLAHRVRERGDRPPTRGPASRAPSRSSPAAPPRGRGGLGERVADVAEEAAPVAQRRQGEGLERAREVAPRARTPSPANAPPDRSRRA